jgi:hypothetical protein
MTPPLTAAGVGDVGEEIGQGAHLVGGQHQLWGSTAVWGIEEWPRESRLSGGMQGPDEDPLGLSVRAALAGAGTAEAAGITHILPIGGAVERAVEAAGIDEGLQQPQRIAEARLPVRPTRCSAKARTRLARFG